MSLKSVLKRLEASGKFDEWRDPLISNDVSVVPDNDTVSFFVAWVRHQKQLSAEALASLSGVSVSSIERIERGESVSRETLDKVAMGLGFQRGYFTEKRRRLTPSETNKKLEQSLDQFEQTLWIDVEPFSKQRHARELSLCDSFIVDTGRLEENVTDQEAYLLELVDLTGFIRLQKSNRNQENGGNQKQISVRDLNHQLLKAVRDIEVSGKGVALFGSYQIELQNPFVFDSEQLEPLKVGVLAFFPKSTDPCAIKRRFLAVPKTFELDEVNSDYFD